MTNYADFGLAHATDVDTTAEITSAAGTSTYTATTATDSAAAYTASANADDLVGRRIENGNVYLICTSNTATAITGAAGWIDKRTGLVGTTPTNGTAYTIGATLRDARETTLGANLYVGHQMLIDGKTGTIVGNNAGIATYGTTFQILNGTGWVGGTPTETVAWQIESLVRYMLDWVEEA
jgi:hypothetical protein